MSMGDLSSLPDEMFTIIEQASSHLRPRLGRLSLPNRHAIQTPHYLASTSRGVVPHLTPDTFERDTRISGVYVPLEDCKLPDIASPTAYLPRWSADNGILTAPQS